MSEGLALLGAAITLGLGLLGLLRPDAAPSPIANRNLLTEPAPSPPVPPQHALCTYTRRAQAARKSQLQ